MIFCKFQCKHLIIILLEYICLSKAFQQPSFNVFPSRRLYPKSNTQLGVSALPKVQFISRKGNKFVTMDSLMDRMDVIFKGDSNEWKPDLSFVMNLLLFAARANNGGSNNAFLLETEVEHVLRVYELLDIRLNIDVGNALLRRWCEEGQVSKARTMLFNMEEIDTGSFNIVIKALSDNGEVENATSMFQLLYQLHEGGKLWLKPDVFTFKTLIRAWEQKSKKNDFESIRAMSEVSSLAQAMGKFEVMYDMDMLDSIYRIATKHKEQMTQLEIRFPKMINNLEAMIKNNAKKKVVPSISKFELSYLNRWVYAGRQSYLDTTKVDFDKLLSVIQFYNIDVEANYIGQHLMMILINTGHVEKAMTMFLKMKEKDALVGSCLLRKYAELGNSEKVVYLGDILTNLYNTGSQDELLLAFNREPTFINALFELYSKVDYYEKKDVGDAIERVIGYYVDSPDPITYFGLKKYLATRISKEDLKFKPPMKFRDDWKTLIQDYALRKETKNVEVLFTLMLTLNEIGETDANFDIELFNYYLNAVTTSAANMDNLDIVVRDALKLIDDWEIEPNLLTHAILLKSRIDFDQLPSSFVLKDFLKQGQSVSVGFNVEGGASNAVNVM